VKPYRRRLIGLPIQRSVFADIDRAPSLIGLTGVLPGDKLGAWLNDEGDLFLDRGDVDRLSTALSERISEQFLAGMERSIRSACHTLRITTDKCHATAANATPEEARRLLGQLQQALTAFVPFGIMSKFVPDILYKAFASTPSAGIPTLPDESPGAALTREAFALFGDCTDAGFPPDRLLAEWPGVPSTINDRIFDFCDAHAGFGPLPWEAPGYEDPRYVFGVLQANFGGCDRGAMLLRFSDRVATTRNHEDAASASSELTPLRRALRRVIITWMEFLERETWYVRRAFYVAMLPLLVRLLPEYEKKSTTILAEDTLFMELEDLISGKPDVSVARVRRENYFARKDYVFEHAISEARLTALFDRVCASTARPRSLVEVV